MGFASLNYTGTGQSASIGVVRTNGTYGVVYLNYATTTNGSTAVLGSDYSAASGTLTFQPTDATKTFNVQILNSNYNSSVEKFVNLTLSGLNPPFNGLASWDLTNAVLRIINGNFQGYLNLSASVYGANLSAGAVNVTVTRTVGSKGSLAVTLATTNGTAVSGTDYIGVTNTLTWDSGDVTPRTVTIPLINNASLGGHQAVRCFTVRADPGWPAARRRCLPPMALSTPWSSITNDNNYGTFQFSTPAYVVNEMGGYATLSVKRTGANTNVAASVQFATIDGTAFADTNYVATNNTLSFAPGQVVASFNVNILNDGRTNPPPSAFYFAGAIVQSPAWAPSLGAPTNASVPIVDAAILQPAAGQRRYRHSIWARA